jgi:hypothetical protein
MAGSRAAAGTVAQNKALTEMAMGYFRSRVLCAAARTCPSRMRGTSRNTTLLPTLAEGEAR